VEVNLKLSNYFCAGKKKKTSSKHTTNTICLQALAGLRTEEQSNNRYGGNKRRGKGKKSVRGEGQGGDLNKLLSLRRTKNSGGWKVGNRVCTRRDKTKRVLYSVHCTALHALYDAQMFKGERSVAPHRLVIN